MIEPTIIDFERAGGFAGLTFRATVNSHSLTADEKEELGRLLDEAGIPQIIEENKITGSSPDQFIYKLTIQRGAERFAFKMTEKHIPPSVKPLLRFLTQKSRHINENNTI